jgi:hypothetical protein
MGRVGSNRIMCDGMGWDGMGWDGIGFGWVRLTFGFSKKKDLKNCWARGKTKLSFLTKLQNYKEYCQSIQSIIVNHVKSKHVKKLLCLQS